MGAILDLLKDIPLSAVLKEKIAGLEAKLGATETENSILQGDLRKARVQIDQLQAEIKSLKEQMVNTANVPSQLDKVAHEILMLFGKLGDKEISKEWIVHSIGGDANTANYYFDDLEENKYIEYGSFNMDEEVPYHLTQKGRKYVIDHSN